MTSRPARASRPPTSSAQTISASSASSDVDRFAVKQRPGREPARAVRASGKALPAQSLERGSGLIDQATGVVHRIQAGRLQRLLSASPRRRCLAPGAQRCRADLISSIAPGRAFAGCRGLSSELAAGKLRIDVGLQPVSSRINGCRCRSNAILRVVRPCGYCGQRLTPGPLRRAACNVGGTWTGRARRPESPGDLEPGPHGPTRDRAPGSVLPIAPRRRPGSPVPARRALARARENTLAAAAGRSGPR